MELFWSSPELSPSGMRRLEAFVNGDINPRTNTVDRALASMASLPSAARASPSTAPIFWLQDGESAARQKSVSLEDDPDLVLRLRLPPVIDLTEDTVGSNHNEMSNSGVHAPKSFATAVQNPALRVERHQPQARGQAEPFGALPAYSASSMDRPGYYSEDTARFPLQTPPQMGSERLGTTPENWAQPGTPPPATNWVAPRFDLPLRSPGPLPLPSGSYPHPSSSYPSLFGAAASLGPDTTASHSKPPGQEASASHSSSVPALPQSTSSSSAETSRNLLRESVAPYKSSSRASTTNKQAANGVVSDPQASSSQSALFDFPEPVVCVAGMSVTTNRTPVPSTEPFGPHDEAAWRASLTASATTSRTPVTTDHANVSSITASTTSATSPGKAGTGTSYLTPPQVSVRSPSTSSSSTSPMSPSPPGTGPYGLPILGPTTSTTNPSVNGTSTVLNTSPRSSNSGSFDPRKAVPDFAALSANTPTSKVPVTAQGWSDSIGAGSISHSSTFVWDESSIEASLIRLVTVQPSQRALTFLTSPPTNITKVQVFSALIDAESTGVEPRTRPESSAKGLSRPLDLQSLTNLFSFGSLLDIYSWSQVCRDWSRTMRSPALWKLKCDREVLAEFQQSVWPRLSGNPAEDPFRLLYRWSRASASASQGLCCNCGSPATQRAGSHFVCAGCARQEDYSVLTKRQVALQCQMGPEEIVLYFPPSLHTSSAFILKDIKKAVAVRRRKTLSIQLLRARLSDHHKYHRFFLAFVYKKTIAKEDAETAAATELVKEYKKLLIEEAKRLVYTNPVFNHTWLLACANDGSLQPLQKAPSVGAPSTSSLPTSYAGSEMPSISRSRPLPSQQPPLSQPQAYSMDQQMTMSVPFAQQNPSMAQQAQSFEQAQNMQQYSRQPSNSTFSFHQQAQNMDVQRNYASGSRQYAQSYVDEAISDSNDVRAPYGFDDGQAGAYSMEYASSSNQQQTHPYYMQHQGQLPAEDQAESPFYQPTADGQSYAVRHQKYHHQAQQNAYLYQQQSQLPQTYDRANSAVASTSQSFSQASSGLNRSSVQPNYAYPNVPMYGHQAHQPSQPMQHSNHPMWSSPSYPPSSIQWNPDTQPQAQYQPMYQNFVPPDTTPVPEGWNGAGQNAPPPNHPFDGYPTSHYGYPSS